MDATVHMLTTTDNPFNPFTQYDEWLAFDEAHGYYTNSLLARVAVSTDELSESIANSAREQAITEIIANDPTNLYTRVTEDQEIKSVLA